MLGTRTTRMRRNGPWAAAVVAWIVLAGAGAGQTSGETVEIRLTSPALNNVLGEPTTRSALVHLPPGYDDEAGRRYPVVYLLHSFGADSESWLGGAGGYEGLNVPATVDSLTRTGSIEPLIVVMPDASTRMGGSWYTDSSSGGNWATFLATDLVAEVDRRFRTDANRGARGIAGQSMGAYGALRIAFEHPGVFGAVFAVSPVMIEDPNPLGPAALEAALDADIWDLQRAPVAARVLWSRATALSPDRNSPPTFARLPWRRVGRTIVRDEFQWARWARATLLGLLTEDPEGVRRLRVRVEVGEDDALADEVASFADWLNMAEAPHSVGRFPGDHVRGVRARFEGAVFQFFTEYFADGVDPQG